MYCLLRLAFGLVTVIFVVVRMAENTELSFNLIPEGDGNDSLVVELPSTSITPEEREEILAELCDGEVSDDEDAPQDDWIPLDEDMLSDALSGGRERSKGANKWARGRFDEWRKAFNHDLSIPLEKIPMRTLNSMLTRFMLQVKKKNKKLYPPATLSCLYRGIGRIVRRERERIQAETGIREIPFEILHDPLFSTSREAFICAIKKTREEGNYDRPRNKAPAISFSEEGEILADIDHQVTHPSGCIKRLAYYMLTRFGIRGAKELRGVLDCDVTLDNDMGGEIIKYGERISKNHQPTATKFDERHFRKPVWTHESDFILTYKQYVRHLPAKEQDSKARPLFLQPILRPRENIWYAVTPVGTNNISKWLKVMASVIGPETQICNKSGRVSLVSRLSAANVPVDVGMSITGHKNPNSYDKYDRNLDLKVDACMDLVSKPINADGTTRSFANVLNDEVSKNRVTGSGSRVVLGELEKNVAVQGSSSRVLRAPDMLQQENTVSVPPKLDGQSGQQISVFDKSGQIVSGDVPKVYCELVEDEYDEDFYKQLSVDCPESARALGKYHSQVMSNSGTFTGCTFNLGIDANQLLQVISAVVMKKS